MVDLVHAGKLDEAEAAARDLLARFPDVHDGWDRLGMVHEARGDNRQAADCYRKVIEFIRRAPRLLRRRRSTTTFVKLIAKLDPPRCDLSARRRSRSAMAPSHGAIRDRDQMPRAPSDTVIGLTLNATPPSATCSTSNVI